MCATGFDLYLGHLQACKYKNLIQRKIQYINLSDPISETHLTAHDNVFLHT